MSERPTLETRRLVLRPFGAADAPEVMRLAGDAAIASTTLNIPHPYDLGMAETWIATHQEGFAEGRLVNFAVTRRDDQCLVGAAGLVVALAHARAELGYWIGKEYWNHGYATEAARAVIHHGFHAMELNRIHARRLARNPASGRVLENVGMRNEGRQLQQILKNGIFEDLELYGLLRENAPPEAPATPS